MGWLLAGSDYNISTHMTISYYYDLRYQIAKKSPNTTITYIYLLKTSSIFCTNMNRLSFQVVLYGPTLCNIMLGTSQNIATDSNIR